MCWRLGRCGFSPWLRAESVVCPWLLQLCLELLFTLVAHNSSRAQLLWPTMHDALASVMSPERTTAAGAPFNTVWRAFNTVLWTVKTIELQPGIAADASCSLPSAAWEHCELVR